MSFIDNTYFIKDISVPVNTVSQSNIDNYIERYENEVNQELEFLNGDNMMNGEHFFRYWFD